MVGQFSRPGRLLWRFEAFAQELTDDVFLAKMNGKANDSWPKRREESNLTNILVVGDDSGIGQWLEPTIFSLCFWRLRKVSFVMIFCQMGCTYCREGKWRKLWKLNMEVLVDNLHLFQVRCDDWLGLGLSMVACFSCFESGSWLKMVAISCWLGGCGVVVGWWSCCVQIFFVIFCWLESMQRIRWWDTFLNGDMQHVFFPHIFLKTHWFRCDLRGWCVGDDSKRFCFFPFVSL